MAPKASFDWAKAAAFYRQESNTEEGRRAFAEMMKEIHIMVEDSDRMYGRDSKGHTIDGPLPELAPWDQRLDHSCPACQRDKTVDPADVNKQWDNETELNNHICRGGFHSPFGHWKRVQQNRAASASSLIPSRKKEPYKCPYECGFQCTSLIVLIGHNLFIMWTFGKRKLLKPHYDAIIEAGWNDPGWLISQYAPIAGEEVLENLEDQTVEEQSLRDVEDQTVEDQSLEDVEDQTVEDQTVEDRTVEDQTVEDQSLGDLEDQRLLHVDDAELNQAIEAYLKHLEERGDPGIGVVGGFRVERQHSEAKADGQDEDRGASAKRKAPDDDDDEYIVRTGPQRPEARVKTEAGCEDEEDFTGFDDYFENRDA